MDVSSKLSAFPLPSVLLSRDTLKSCIYEVTLKWQVKTSRPFLCDCLSPWGGPAFGLGPSCHRAPGGWHRGFPAEAEQDAKADLRTPRLCLSAPFLNS